MWISYNRAPTNLISSKVKDWLSSQKNCHEEDERKSLKYPALHPYMYTPVIQINCACNICRLTHCFGFFSFGIKNRKFKLCSDFGFVARNEKEIQWQVVFALLIQALRIHSQTPRNQLSHQLTRLLPLPLYFILFRYHNVIHFKIYLSDFLSIWKSICAIGSLMLLLRFHFQMY